MKKKLLFMTLTNVAALCIMFCMAACGTDEDLRETVDPVPPDEDLSETVDPVPQTDCTKPITAKPVAVNQSTSGSKDERLQNLKILDSMTDGEKNYYLLDVGYIKDLYLSTIATVNYTGVPLSYTLTSSSQTSYTSSLTESVSKSVTVSDSNQHTVGLSKGIRFGIKSIADVSIQANYEWSGTWTNSETSGKSIENTETGAREYAKSQTYSFNFGKDTDPKGKYRYALYGVCDIYFVVTTNRNNTELIDWEAQSCARPGEYMISVEFTESNTEFINDTEGTIDIRDDFYKALPLPTEKVQETDGPIKYDAIKYTKTVRTRKTVIYNGHNNVTDTIIFSFAQDADELEKKGYNVFSIKLSFEIKEYRTSPDLFNGIEIQDKSGDTVKDWKYARHRGDWEWYMIEINDIPMSRFYMENNEFKVKLKYYCRNSNFQDWYLGDVKIEITASCS